MSHYVSFFPSTYSLMYHEMITNILLQVLPRDATALEDTQNALPIITRLQDEGNPDVFSFFLLCKQRTNGSKFFYEMITRYLLPGKILNAEMFFSLDCHVSFSSDLHTIAQLTLHVDGPSERESIERSWNLLEKELRLGFISFYYANRILEAKGLSSDTKTMMIQEHIAHMQRKAPSYLQDDIFPAVQHFLIACGDIFKSTRDYRHLSRIICTHYLFRKDLEAKVTCNPQQYYANVKILKIRKSESKSDPFILGIIVGMNFIHDTEIFEKTHLLKAIQQHIPQAESVKDSFFVHHNKNTKICMMYLEIKQNGGADFSLEEVMKLRHYLPAYMQARIERRQQPLFMPRNEEEIMRHIIVLSSQLKAAKNIPQVVISFDRQTAEEIVFIVILLRPLHKSSIPLEEMFKQSSSTSRFLIDQIRTVGFIRRKYPKEANVFHIHLEKKHFLRDDHSVDLSKARQSVVTQLNAVLGEFRDYNGGMISKEHELFYALKQSLPKQANYDDFLLENFFYSLTPAVMRSVLHVKPLKEAFVLLLQALSETQITQELSLPYYYFSKQQKEYFYVIVATNDSYKQEKIDRELRKQHRLLRIEQHVIYSSVQVYKLFYCIYIYHYQEQDKQTHVLQTLKQVLDAHL